MTPPQPQTEHCDSLPVIAAALALPFVEREIRKLRNRRMGDGFQLPSDTERRKIDRRLKPLQKRRRDLLTAILDARS